MGDTVGSALAEPRLEMRRKIRNNDADNQVRAL